MIETGGGQGIVSSNGSQAAPIVFVVDDDISVRESLELLLRSVGLRTQIFSTAEQFLAYPCVVAPACLILDVSLPGVNGLDLQQRIALDRADMPVIFITGHGDVPMTVRAMKAGAVEFLTKPFDDEMLLQAVADAVERSRAAIDGQVELRALQASYATLTRREREVMALVVSGLLNKQIGGELGISEITVKIHRGKVMQKMEAGSLPELVYMAAKLCLTTRRARRQ
ncbi:LuxR family transcriptional regulator [Burkholderia lata]|uniref:response regulator transcription factor n=1 Tax=Burkholderia lata (strain ATCC 17760 / DSM 23089 / LMG 22485 / NCIMB 9086 / R18194 / 383) TaxID=482957 RepID=UPI0014548496|nr:response regulator [Burkholderia lata]VWB37403.1 LuxR family transcriptional regulator [Burkholderia lata]